MQTETDWLTLPDGSTIKPSKINSCRWDGVEFFRNAGYWDTRPVFIVHITGAPPLRFFGFTADDTARVLADWMISDYPTDEIDSRKWPSMIKARRAREAQQASLLKEHKEKRVQRKRWWVRLFRVGECA